jgi:hypothetical protein
MIYGVCVVAMRTCVGGAFPWVCTDDGLEACSAGLGPVGSDDLHAHTGHLSVTREPKGGVSFLGEWVPVCLPTL